MQFSIKTYIPALFLLTILFSCNEPKKSSDEKPVTAAQEEPEVITTTVLTSEQIKAVGITLGSLEQKNLTATIKANGLLRVPNKNSAHATSLYGGAIKTLQVEIGDIVRKGQVIATIENPQFIQLQEEYLTVINDLSMANLEYARQKELNEGNAGVMRNLQDASNRRQSLEARKASLQKQIQMMGINPSAVSTNNLRNALTITSPINGTISNVFARIGSYVDVSSPVAEIVDNSQLHLDLQVFEQDLPKIKTGQLIRFTITNNPTVNYTAKVFSIGSSFQNSSKTVAVHSDILGDKRGLIDGMNITANVELDNILSTAVVTSALVESDGKTYLFIVKDPDSPLPEGDMEFEKIEVSKGTTSLGYTAIVPVRNLSDKVRIVTKGAFFINAKMSDIGEHDH